MSQHVKVEQGGAAGRGLDFRGVAAFKHNVYGNFNPEKHLFYCDFDSPAADETNDWAVNESHGGSGAISVAKNGVYRLTTTTTDDDKCELARSRCWYASCAAVIEVRLKVDVITDVKINVGFSDLAAEANDLTAFAISGTSAVATADEAVCFVFDTDGSADYWYIANVKVTTAGSTSIAIAPEADKYEIFMIALDTLGNATYYRNGAPVGYKALAITTTIALTPYIAVQLLGNAGVARNLDVDYIKCWQNRG